MPPMPETPPQQFASDNYSGICPQALDAIVRASAAGSAPAYGDDPWTRLAEDAIRTLFDTDAAVFFVFNGTAANALALATLCPPYCSIIATDIAHADTSERGAPEFFTGGSKLMTPPCPDGKLTSAAIKLCCRKAQSPQASGPAVVTITQPTENGLLYTPEEIRALADTCHEHGLSLHMDGARLANAIAALGCPPAAITWQAGVDALSFGGTKNGMAVGDAVVFFNRKLSRGFAERAKQGGQIASKMRFITAPWLSMIQSGAWLENARHGNACARLFATELAGVSGLELAWPVQSNGVFLLLPEQSMNTLRAKGWRFYTMFGGVARFLFGWDAKPEAVKALAADIRASMQA
ncbi:threonine aldolase [Acetobacter tropicalis]|nr:beta-eliminating lyase-related protein [Acetobacter tropicalis]KAA8385471.1 threonine aldolase [Acetobacter tropicalis]KAA8389722.1 threonine aldolase [Acetobacter tropicalis]MBC9008824.1 threonine aldolase [Acetobacter tropicalis]MDO8171998.1 beta-eliminating lyase-related protein [Acetobacter tropicalis]